MATIVESHRDGHEVNIQKLSCMVNKKDRSIQIKSNQSLFVPRPANKTQELQLIMIKGKYILKYLKRIRVNTVEYCVAYRTTLDWGQKHSLNPGKVDRIKK